MNLISNIWKQPKTSLAGLLIAIIAIAGVLSQQGISLGTAGNGTVVALLSSLATALLGLLARDPSGDDATSSIQPGRGVKLGAWALICLLLHSILVSGCSGASVAKDIVNWTPALESAVATVDRRQHFSRLLKLPFLWRQRPASTPLPAFLSLKPAPIF